jgi:hypothetical protein
VQAARKRRKFPVVQVPEWVRDLVVHRRPPPHKAGACVVSPACLRRSKTISSGTLRRGKHMKCKSIRCGREASAWLLHDTLVQSQNLLVARRFELPQPEAHCPAVRDPRAPAVIVQHLSGEFHESQTIIEVVDWNRVLCDGGNGDGCRHH